jgi:Restriction endonuclease XhoI
VSLDLASFDAKAREAVRAFWGARDAAIQKSIALGKADMGGRGGVTAGKNMDGFVALVLDVVRANGLPDACVRLERRVLTLPGYFRPTKLWDLLIINHGRLVAAVEFKSQVGPSFGNNFNNRTEEAIGNALDFWTAYREGAFCDVPRPFVGFLFHLEDCEASRRPVNDASPNFPVMPDFRGVGYAGRYNLLCKKLVQEQLYTSAALILSERSAIQDGAYSQLDEMTGLRSFIATLAGHIAAEAAR